MESVANTCPCFFGRPVTIFYFSLCGMSLARRHRLIIVFTRLRPAVGEHVTVRLVATWGRRSRSGRRSGAGAKLLLSSLGACACVGLFVSCWIRVKRSALKSLASRSISIFQVCVVTSLSSESASVGDAVLLSMSLTSASISGSGVGIKSVVNLGLMVVFRCSVSCFWAK
jgi:hypothetical protein